MDSLAQTKGRNYTPHLLATRVNCCKRVRESGWPVAKVLSYYHVRRSSLYRWLKRYDALGKEGLRDIPRTPEMPGEKWQIDVKYVPSECKAPGLEGRFYQYTYLDEATRKRYLHYANEHSMYETVKGLKEAIAFFGYKPKEIQTDNGFEFSDRAAAKGKDFSATGRDGPNILERFCLENGIRHKFIRPRTPEHNGKVERSHRIDQEKFYRFLKFFSLADLASQGARWNKRYNETPRMVLKLRSPNQVELEKLKRLMQDTGEVRCQKLLKRLTSFDN